MPAFIHHIATAVPRFSYAQDYACEKFKAWSPDPRTRRIIQAIFSRSGISNRHSVVGDFVEGEAAALFQPSPEGIPLSPGTAARNRIYAGASRDLAVTLARRTLEEAEGFGPGDITHLVFASCTGFANPGPDYHIIRDLGLDPAVERYTLGFMGCYAAFPALRMAAQFCEANPRAVVLVMCLELCTLHMQISDRSDSILANSLFADGAAAAIVSARQPLPHRPAFRMGGFRSHLLPSGERDMAWEIGDEGFNIILSSYVPDIISANLGRVLESTLRDCGLDLADIEAWAVHPGGRSILDKVEAGLALPPDSLAPSRAVLRRHGNMSSATILFVLRQMLEQADTDRALTCAMAFGPGLTVELAMLERCGRSRPAADRDTEEVSRRFEDPAAAMVIA